MSKKEQLIEFISQDIIEKICENQNVEYDEPMNLFYNSQFFEKLQDDATGLYLEGSDYLYELFADEMKFGKIIQKEI